MTGAAEHRGAVALHPAIAEAIERGIDAKLAPLAESIADFSRAMLVGLQAIHNATSRQSEAGSLVVQEVVAMSRRLSRLEVALGSRLAPDIPAPPPDG